MVNKWFCHMKVFIWKPDLGVVWNKKQDISTTTRDIKNPKLGFCRGDLDLFDDMKILVNKCWLKLWICWLKSKNAFKNGTFYGAAKSLGGFRNMEFKHVIWCLKQAQRMYLILYQTILWYLKNWKKNRFFEILTKSIFSHF